MANSEGLSTSKVLCRYYKHGCCRRGVNCTFSHDLSSKEDSICKFYLKGACSYGSECRFDHIKQHRKILCPPVGNTLLLPEKPPVTEQKSRDWAQAAEFVPGAKYHGKNYAQIAAVDDGAALVPNVQVDELCPWKLNNGLCNLGDECNYVHGDICGMCGSACLHPNDENQRIKHEKDCGDEHEKAMEASFAIARSKDKICGVCMEKVLDKKPPSEARFGILSHCNHVFCLSCIRRWRGQEKFEKRVVRACPECRVCSNFVTPSIIWVEDEAEKKKLMENYKNALAEKPCRYWDYGKGDCPFNEHCFYKHTDEQGVLMPPKPKPKRRLRENGDAEIEINYFLWDFLETREDNAEILEEILLYDNFFHDDVTTDSEEYSD